MIPPVCFEGLNRSGKGTQIKMLRNYLETVCRPVEVLRGDGSRPGINSQSFYDPKSEWWVNWQANKEKRSSDWNLAYHILTEENSFRYEEFYNENPDGIILMDRSYISRYFMLRQQGVETSLEKVAKDTKLCPETYFVLEVPKNLLLERVSDDYSSKAVFRREIVWRWYGLWVDVIDTAQEFLKDKLKRIDGTQSPEIIHEYIKANV